MGLGADPIMAGATAITCPECNKKFKGKEDLNGKKIRCPFCKEPFVVSFSQAKDSARAGAKVAAKEKKAEAPPPAKAPEPPPQTSPAGNDDEDGGNPYGVTDLDLTYRCPHCTKPMKDEQAVVCIYCGYNTLTREHGHTEKIEEDTFGERFMWLLPGLVGALFVVLLVLYMIYFSIQLPVAIRGSWAELFDHESMRMWNAAISLILIWGMGFFAFKRLVLNPKPPPKVKD
jgi:DNA-directed RNA polymerase subunit RPC12/RpoP